MEFSHSGSSLSQIVLSLFLFHVFFIPLTCSLSDLVFLDLGTQENEFNNADDDTRLIRLPSSFHFGKQNFHTSYISSNGLLSFGTSFNGRDPTSFPLSSAVVIAPFWDDIYLTYTGIAKYGIVTPTNTPNIINEVEKFLELNQNIVLKLDWVLVAKWMNVCPYENINCVQTNTFQVVIASQGSTSYSIFTYKCDLLQWTRHNTAIGYSAGPDYFENHPFSRTSKVTDIDCLNSPLSVWSNVVYKLNNGSDPGLGFSIDADISPVTPFFATPTPNDTLGSGSGLGSGFESSSTGLKISIAVTTAVIFIIIIIIAVLVIVVLIKRKSKKENFKSRDKTDDITMTISPSYNIANTSTTLDKTDDITMTISPSYNIANTSTTLAEKPLYESIPELTECQECETPVDSELTECQEYETPVVIELTESQEYETIVVTELIEFPEYDVTEIYDLSELITYIALNINPAYVTPCAQQPDSSQTCVNSDDDSDIFW